MPSDCGRQFDQDSQTDTPLSRVMTDSSVQRLSTRQLLRGANKHGQGQPSRWEGRGGGWVGVRDRRHHAGVWDEGVAAAVEAEDRHGPDRAAVGLVIRPRGRARREA